MRALGLAGLLLLAFASGAAQAAEGEWRFFGTVQLDGENQCFFNLRSIARQGDNAVRVQTMCLRQADLDAVDIRGRILDATSTKLAQGYAPPIGRVMRLTANEIITITGFEQTVALADIVPHLRILYEFDCAQHRSRQIDDSGGTEKPSEWHAIQPTGNGATLLALACALR